MPFNVDPQIDGTADDGSSEGYKKARLIASGLVLMPFEQNGFHQANGSGWSRTFSENPDGSYSGVFFNIPAGSTTPGILQWRSRGKAAGFRWNPGIMAGIKSMGILSFRVDNRDFVVLPYALDSVSGVADNSAYNQRQFAVHDLPGTEDTDHFCQVMVPPPPAGSPNSQVRIYGYLVDGAAGYLLPQRIGTFEVPFTLTNAFVTVRAILDSGDAVQMRPRGIQSLHFYNTDSSAHLVQIAHGSGPTTMYDIPLGAAGATTYPPSSATWPPAGSAPFADSLGDWLGLSLKADANSVVQCTIKKES